MREFQRRHGRTDVELPIDYIRSDVTAHAAVTKNLGTGGLFVATEHLADVRDRLALKFRVPGWENPIAVDGEVRWLRQAASPEHPDWPVGMGLKFVGLTVGALLVIEEFLRMVEPGDASRGFPFRRGRG